LLPPRVARHDVTMNTCAAVFAILFLPVNPLQASELKINENKTKHDWAQFVEEIALHYKEAEKITLIIDNLNTHSPGALYETFPPDRAKTLLERFEFVYTPKHGSWLNMAEIELNVLTKQCLNRRIADIAVVRSEVSAWQAHRNNR